MTTNHYQKTTLDNGIRIITEYVPNVRSVSSGIWVEVGSRDENENEFGISHLLEHMLFKGTTSRSPLDIAREFDAVGGISNAFTSKEHTCFHAKVLDVHLGRVVDVLLDMFIRSVFSSEDLEVEKSVVLQEISMIEDSPEDLVHVLFGEAFWDGNPLGRSILGSRENISRVHRQAVLDYIHKAYAPSNVLVSAAGNVRHEDLVSLLRPELDALPPRPYERRRPVPMPRKVETFQSKDIEQVHVCLGGPGPATTDESRFADTLLHILLGGNMSSRLFQEIREKSGLAYSVYSFVNNFADAGMLGVYLGVGRDTIEEALERTARVFAGLREGDITPDDLQAAKQYLEGNILLGSENTDNRMFRIAKNEFAFGRYIAYEELEADIEKVTLEQLVEIARLRLDPECLSVTVLGPLDTKPAIFF